jgi:hypothetical protein
MTEQHPALLLPDLLLTDSFTRAVDYAPGGLPNL